MRDANPAGMKMKAGFCILAYICATKIHLTWRF